MFKHSIHFSLVLKTKPFYLFFKNTKWNLRYRDFREKLFHVKPNCWSLVYLCDISLTITSIVKRKLKRKCNNNSRIWLVSKTSVVLGLVSGPADSKRSTGKECTFTHRNYCGIAFKEWVEIRRSDKSHTLDNSWEGEGRGEDWWLVQATLFNACQLHC